MAYSLTKDASKNCFAVPARVAEKLLKIAKYEQLQVLLWVLGNPGGDVSSAAEKLRLDPGAVSDCLGFWVEMGILDDDGSPFVPSAAPAPALIQTKDSAKLIKHDLDTLAPAPAGEKKPLPEITFARPTPAQIAVRCKEDADISFLLNESQKKLGRTLGFDGQCNLLMLHDTFGLPVEVILMLLEYCVQSGKTSNAYIASVGKSWAEREIDTLERADAQISALTARNALWSAFTHRTGISTPKPTSKQAEFLRVWNEDWGFGVETICAAFEEMSDHCSKVSFNYINKILVSWHEQGVSSAADAAALKAKADAVKQPSAKSPKRQTSYNLDEFNQSSLNEPIVYEKKKK